MKCDSSVVGGVIAIIMRCFVVESWHSDTERRTLVCHTYGRSFWSVRSVIGFYMWGHVWRNQTKPLWPVRFECQNFATICFNYLCFLKYRLLFGPLTFRGDDCSYMYLSRFIKKGLDSPLIYIFLWNSDYFSIAWYSFYLAFPEAWVLDKKFILHFTGTYVG
jgi:hypothetical protein